ncbi:MAG: cellulase family glycosylhydrolase [Fibrobacterales bacterium]|nr:cellulase family glycosylhydrolase [Fibrobacterales bacterium]
MKKTNAILLSLALCAVQARAEGFLKAVGQELRSGNGAGPVVVLNGANIGGLVHEPWMSPLYADEAASDWQAYELLDSRFGEEKRREAFSVYRSSWLTEKDFELMAREGMNVVRLPVYYQWLMDTNGNWLTDASGSIDFSRLDWAIETAGRHGLWTIVDLHGAPGSQNGADHSGEAGRGAKLFTDNPGRTKYQNMTLKWWRGVAEHLAGNPLVAGYDVLNEPSRTFSNAMEQDVVDLYKKIYPEIRAVDTNHVVIFEAIWTWNKLQKPANYGWKNVMYELHCYGWDHIGDDKLAGMKGFVDGQISDANRYRPDYGVPLLIGEYTFFSSAAAWEYGLGKYRDNGISWTVWTWKVKGPGSSWGVYTNKDDNTPSVKWNDFATILDHWGKWSTAEHFKRNDMVADAIRKVTGKLLHPQADTLAVPGTRRAPSIDGEIDDVWSGAVRLELGNVVRGTAERPARDDFSVEARLLWDEENLYLLVDATDQTLSTSGANSYDDDGFELYLDVGGRKGESYGEGQFQFTAAFGDARLAENKRNADEGVEMVQKAGEGGYRVEIAIPWTTLGARPEAGTRIGIDVHAVDNDGGESRKTKLAWAAHADETWEVPGLMGTVRLGELPPPGESAANSGFSLQKRGFSARVAGDDLYIEGVRPGTAVELFDLRGARALSARAEGETTVLGLGALPRGNYFVRAAGQVRAVGRR